MFDSRMSYCLLPFLLSEREGPWKCFDEIPMAEVCIPALPSLALTFCYFSLSLSLSLGIEGRVRERGTRCKVRCIAASSLASSTRRWHCWRSEAQEDAYAVRETPCVARLLSPHILHEPPREETDRYPPCLLSHNVDKLFFPVCVPLST